uniref:Uncharacterized protein n=1 Tax=Magallana gigas TaxID=29159 RepID=A0A8W8LS79_MAGGI
MSRHTACYHHGPPTKSSVAFVTENSDNVPLTFSNQVRPGSPVPRGLHFEKNRSLSRSPARGQRLPSPAHNKSSNEAKDQLTGDLNKKESGY